MLRSCCDFTEKASSPRLCITIPSHMRIFPEKCDLCGACIDVCPQKAIEATSRSVFLNGDCSACGLCITVCSNEAIEGENRPQGVQDDDDYRGVWVFIERNHGALNPASVELVEKARALASRLDTYVGAAIFGEYSSIAVAGLYSLGVNHVYAVDHETLDENNYSHICDALNHLALQFKPEILLFAATCLGRSLAPRLAMRLKTGITADCTDLEIQEDTRLLLQTRPTYGGNMMATITCPVARPQIATVRPGVFKPGNHDPGLTGETSKISLVFKDISAEYSIIENVKIRPVRNIVSASVIVAGGRGMGSRENFSLLDKFAYKVGGVVAGYREQLLKRDGYP